MSSSTTRIHLIVFLLALLTSFSSSQDNASTTTTSSSSTSIPGTGNNCLTPKIPIDPHIHKQKYRIAIQAFNGFEAALQDYNLTFVNYLSSTAGQAFDPPIDFELVPVTFNGLFHEIEVEKSVDLVYANPGSYSCIGVEVGAQPLVTKVTKVSVRGHEYNLDVFGGVIFARADRTDIHTIYDLKDKIIGAGAITDIKGGQAQLYEMVKAEMNFVTDPKQVVFTSNQLDVVAGVLNGDFDVGMVRTDQIEKSVDANGKPIDPELFYVLEPKIHLLDDGQLFPFHHSTDVFPEWPLAALPHVPADVSTQVQLALLALSEHARPWEELVQCKKLVEEEAQAQLEQLRDNKKMEWQFTMYDQKNEDINNDLNCDALFWESISRCDTTPELSKLAYESTKAGKIDGFRSPRSYFEVRTMQERAGFLTEDPVTHKWECIRAGELRDSLICPAGHYKLTQAEFDESCEFLGLECKEGHDCYCNPCIKAFEVDVFQFFPEEGYEVEEYVYSESEESKHEHEEVNHELLEHIDGCEKMSLCGIMEQREVVHFRAIDNKKRPNAKVSAIMHLGQTSHEIPLYKVVNDHTYELEWSETAVGVGIVEITVDGEQISESPLRVQVIPRSCQMDGDGANRKPDDEGNCICEDGNVEIHGTCVSTTILAVVGSVLGLVAVIVVGYFFVQHNNYKNDLVWHVNADELRFDDPVEVIGEGAYGVVLKAEYRGTKVAIKKALRAKRSGKGSAGGRGSTSGMLVDHLPTQRPSGIMSLDADADSGIYSNAMSLESSDEVDESEKDDDVENQVDLAEKSYMLKSTNRNSAGIFSKGRKSAQSGGLDLTFLEDLYGKGGRRGKRGYGNDNFNEALSIVSSGSIKVQTIYAKCCPWLDEHARREEAFVAEMRLLSSLRHPCICTVMGAVMSRDHTPMLVMEYMEYGSLHDLLRNETMYLSGEIILQIARDVAQGLRYLHTAKPPIQHGDLKPANILVDNRFRAKVCDFGLSQKKKYTLSGTLFWLAPEYLIGNEDYNEACDMYSMGIILNEVYSRTRPYAGEDTDLKTLLKEICDRRVNRRPVMAETLPPRMAELVKKLWSRNPTVRPPAKELDTMLMDMNVQDAEPMTTEQMNAKPRTEDMLYELFPRHIAEALKAGRKVEPETHELVTIVFSDIKGFTDISREISPMKVSMMLDRLYLAFDKIARKHGVFKVETIGDAYMGVTNLTEDQEDTHVKRIAEFAVEMINEAAQILIDEDEPDKGYIRIRVGFHSGPVVANVIGSLNPRYGLFGDTVNTASRMESNSTGSRILCSESAYLHLKRQAPEMPFICRGKIAVKGKGDMNTYWIGDDLIRKNKKIRRKTKVLRFQRMEGDENSLEGGKPPQFNVERHDSEGSTGSLMSAAAEAVKAVETDNSLVSLGYSDEHQTLLMKGNEDTMDGDGNEASGDDHGSRETAETALSENTGQLGLDSSQQEVFSDEPGSSASPKGMDNSDGSFVRSGPLGRFQPASNENQ